MNILDKGNHLAYSLVEITLHSIKDKVAALGVLIIM